MKIDPSITYPNVIGISSDAKHPNGDLDRISLTGDHTVGFTMRGEPIVWMLERMHSLNNLHVRSEQYYWQYDHLKMVHYGGHDVKEYFSRSADTGEINTLQKGIKDFYGRMITSSNIEARVSSEEMEDPYGEAFFRDYADKKIDLNETCRTAAFDRVRRGDVIHRNLIKAMHDDLTELDGLVLYKSGEDEVGDSSLIKFNVYKTSSGGQLPFASEPINLSGDSYDKIHPGGYETVFKYNNFNGKTWDGKDVKGVNYIVPASGIPAASITPKNVLVKDVTALLKIKVSSNNPPYSGKVWYPIRMRKEFDDLYVIYSDNLRSPDMITSLVNLIGSSTEVHPDKDGYYNYNASLSIKGVDYLLTLKKE